MSEKPITSIDRIKIIPTHVAQSCPVCNSWGTLRYGKVTCHACDGKGYILIPAEEVKK
ncbi:MAG TPA: hypothetical protein VNW29_01975 [Candidatus Sulfotelmatobacter sp.]|jgi:hypothetical protein|nr:hypothetical protein [Candidatus Sulfotelmatobacter sp.]